MELCVKESGPAGAPSLVFLHGGGGGAWMWEPQVETLEAEFHCLAPDLPRHGCSARVGPLTMGFAAAQVAELIQTRAHGGAAHVVGLSLGAQVAVELLSRFPERVQSAVISSALLQPMPGGQMMANPTLLRLLYGSALAPFKNWDAYIRLNMKYSAGIPDDYFVYFREAFQQTTAEAWTETLVANQTYRLPPGLERVQVPVLVVTGQHEYGAMQASAQSLAQALPRAQRVTVAHPGRWSLAEEHNWSMKAPELFTEMVRAWISGQPLPEAIQPAQGPVKVRR